jgi:hypothetical protein
MLKTGKKYRKTTKNQKPEKNQNKTRENLLKMEETLGKKNTAAANGPAHHVGHFRRERFAPAVRRE